MNSFIERKLKEYIEPQRKGTPKGKPIGFSRKKYQAALYMVYHPRKISIKGIAGCLDIKEQTLRLWRTQKDFKNKVSEIKIEFNFYRRLKLQELFTPNELLILFTFDELVEEIKNRYDNPKEFMMTLGPRIYENDKANDTRQH